MIFSTHRTAPHQSTPEHTTKYSTTKHRIAPNFTLPFPVVQYLAPPSTANTRALIRTAGPLFTNDPREEKKKCATASPRPRPRPRQASAIGGINLATHQKSKQPAGASKRRSNQQAQARLREGNRQTQAHTRTNAYNCTHAHSRPRPQTVHVHVDAVESDRRGPFVAVAVAVGPRFVLRLGERDGWSRVDRH